MQLSKARPSHVAPRLEPLAFEEKANRRYKNATPTKLYSTAELEKVAVDKWGGMPEVEAERNAREQKRLKRALETAGPAADSSTKKSKPGLAAGPAPAYDPSDSPQLPAWITERVRICQRLPPTHLNPPHPDLNLNPPSPAQPQQQKPQSAAGVAASSQPDSSQPEFMLYWMRTAIRGHENPALDVAKHEAKQQGLPLLVAAFVLTTHPYPTARRFKFWLEGLRDTQRELRAQASAHLSLGPCRDLHAGLELLIYLEGVTGASAAATQGAAPAASSALGPSTGSAGTRGGVTQAESSGWADLMKLVQRACAVVTEDMPVDPDARDLQATPAGIKVLAVDTACQVPMQSVKCSTSKAYIFRSATEKPRKERMDSMPYADAGHIALIAPYASQAGGVAAAGAEDHPDAQGASTSAATDSPNKGQVPEGLGWQPLDLSADDVDISQLLQQCRGIDHSVPGIIHTTGGSTAAYTRWEKFKLAGLNQYAAKRNNSMLRNAVSRQSAYHHFGMISPFKVARDLNRNSSNGARKFFDEFMTWRELSYAFCFQHWPELESMQALPEWSRCTLQAHASDPRPHVMSDEQLDKGETGDPIWDAAQYQLALTGELHNNIRMTWGKAILPWSPDPDTAIKRTVYLNHKYALDGCDPCSYSGILWCYGQFDKPMGPEKTPIYGKLRKRDTSVVGNKLDVATYRSLAINPDSNEIGGKPAQKAISDFFAPRH
ncbi:hypothetical protein ABBQ32_006586 [Trebouxia sp. C0010 RCD-2024]